jgi:hypothetical protein
VGRERHVIESPLSGRRGVSSGPPNWHPLLGGAGEASAAPAEAEPAAGWRAACVGVHLSRGALEGLLPRVVLLYCSWVAGQAFSRGLREGHRGRHRGGMMPYHCRKTIPQGALLHVAHAKLASTLLDGDRGRARTY